MIRCMKTHVTTLTERGQISIPADFRAGLGLHPGQKLLWTEDGDRALRLTVCEPPRQKTFTEMLGFGRSFGPVKTTAECMRELREGEDDA